MTNPLKYTCLFGGGAIRGLAYVGTVRALEELGIEYDIIGGSSVGAIIASLVACGYKSYELENFFLKVNFDLFKDIHLCFGKSFGIWGGLRCAECSISSTDSVAGVGIAECAYRELRGLFPHLWQAPPRRSSGPQPY